MRQYNETEARAEYQFAHDAAAYFAKHPHKWSYGEIKPYGLLGMRWGLGSDCVLVLRLDGEHEPIVYPQVIKTPECDGNHGGPRCGDPGCWNDSPPS